MGVLEQLEKAVGRVGSQVDLRARTSVRVGGRAQLFAQPQTEKALAQAIDLCVQHAMPYAVLGGGTNTIVSDRGVQGLVVKLGPRLVAEEVAARGEGASLKVGAGQPTSRLVALARARELVGMEFLAGIPGTLGGAVAMNAGTKAGSLGSIVEEVGICEPGRARTLRAEEVGFAYRRTALPAHAVVTWARFRLEQGDVDLSRAAMEEDLANRRRTQPLTLPNSGSVFRNPPGDHAGRLIQACGLKGERVGGAQVSELHANFIVNRGQATASDVLLLMRRMQEAVRERFGTLLVPEVRLMGEFDPAELPMGLGLPAEPAA